MNQYNRQFGRAQRIAESGDPAKALEIYDELIERDPKFAAAWAYRSKTLQDLDRFDEAAASISTAIEIEPDRCAWHTMKASVECVRADYDAVFAAARAALELDPNNPLAKGYAALAQAGQGNWRAAVDEMLGAGLPCQPDFQANAFVLVEPELDRISADVEKPSFESEPPTTAMSRVPVIRSIAATYHLRMAERAADRQRADDAVGHALRAYALTPRRFGIDEFVAEVFLIAGDKTNAERFLKRASESRPDDPIVLYLSGRLDLANNRAERAVKMFSQSIELDHELEDTYYWMGRASLAVGEPQQAVRWFRRFALRDARFLRDRLETMQHALRSADSLADLNDSDKVA